MVKIQNQEKDKFDKIDFINKKGIIWEPQGISNVTKILLENYPYTIFLITENNYYKWN